MSLFGNDEKQEIKALKRTIKELRSEIDDSSTKKQIKVLKEQLNDFKSNYNAELNKATKDLKEKLQDLKVEHKRELETAEITYAHNEKISGLELIELKKEETVNGILAKKDLELAKAELESEKKQFKDMKATIIQEAKREAAIEIKEEYIKINEKLLDGMMRMQGISTTNMNELRQLADSKVKIVKERK